VDVVGGNRVIKDAKTVAFPCLKDPLKVPPAVSGKLQKKFLLMTPVSNMPDITRYVMPTCPRHLIGPFLEGQF